jgi:signal transduction histidine kinase
MPATRLAGPALAAAAVLLGVLAYRTQVHDLHAVVHAVAIVAVAWCFVAAGLVAWGRRPDNHVGPLMVAAGFALLLRQFRYSHDALTFTVFFALGEVGYVLAVHSALAYPAGRVSRVLELDLLQVAYAVAVVFPVAILLVHSPHGRLLTLSPLPRRSLVNVADDDRLAIDLQKAYDLILYGGLAAAFIVVTVQRLAAATLRARRMLAPLLLAACAIALRAVFETVFTFVSRPLAYDYLFWWQIAAFMALPLALLAGLLRARLARATVGDLVLELERTPPDGIRDALARALRDPALEVAFWLPEQRAYADASGRAVELPEERSSRAVTRLDDDDRPLAALVHDRSLLEEQRLVDAAGAAARMALVNARLKAELNAQLLEVEESRERVAAAAGDERRRLERDLHDGAQQRLVALALQLRIAQRRFGGTADPAVEAILNASVDQLQAAVVELRDLAHGANPVTDGLTRAIESLAARTPLVVSVDVPDLQLPPQVEAAAYFVACEALANTVKHAQASRVSVSARQAAGVLTIEVADDGIGGASGDGFGLRSLADRVAALGGGLRVESEPGQGTRVIGEIPCAS